LTDKDIAQLNLKYCDAPPPTTTTTTKKPTTIGPTTTKQTPTPKGRSKL